MCELGLHYEAILIHLAVGAIWWVHYCPKQLQACHRSYESCPQESIYTRARHESQTSRRNREQISLG